MVPPRAERPPPRSEVTTDEREDQDKDKDKDKDEREDKDELDDDRDDDFDDVDSFLRQVAHAPPVEVPAPIPELAEGTLVDDCFRIVSRLGRGGMGVVYLADHLQLERKVALKLHSTAADETGTSQLMQEARAMARVVHDNVITVFDVGTFDDRVYVAMEFMDGGTVRDWLGQTKRSREEIVRVFVAAARGLAAAHRAGLVHRDFKPDNVLVGRDGRVRVADFGLARAAGGNAGVPVTQPMPALTEDLLPPRDDPELRLTATGAIVGTPAYMAPEQLQGQPADPRCDQYAFCVSLYEALYGRRPFRGKSLGALINSMSEGKPVEPPSDLEVPSWVRDVLRRGLSHDPAQRYETMDALIRVLAVEPAVARRRRLAILLGVVMLAAGVGLAQLADDEDPCAGGRAHLDAVYGSSQAETLEQALIEHGGSLGATVGPRVRKRLQDYSETWLDAHREACEATHIKHVQSDEALDLRMACLDERRTELAAIVEILMAGDRQVVNRADQAVLSLSSVVPCEDVDALRRVESIAEDDRAAVQRLQDALAHAKGEWLAGHYDASLALAEQALGDARGLGYASLESKAHAGLGDALSKHARNEEASTAYERAVNLAVQARDDALVLDNLLDLIYVDGYQRKRFELGERWANQAEAWIVRSSAPPMSTVRLLHGRALISREQGKLDAAVSTLEDALEVVDSIEGDKALSARESITATLAMTLRVRGDMERALEAHAQALSLARSIYGADHPTTATEMVNTAVALLQAGKSAEAEPLLRSALQIREPNFAPSHFNMLSLRLNLGMVLLQLQRPDEAIEQMRQAEAHMDSASDHVRATISATLGMAFVDSGQLEQAQERLERAFEITRASKDPNATSLVQVRSNLASLAIQRGRYAEAEAHAREGLAFIEQSSREDLRQIEAFLYFDLGRALRGQGQLPQATEQLERALAGLDGYLHPRHEERHGFLTTLALCYLDAGEPDRAEPLLRQSLDLSGSISAEEYGDSHFVLARTQWAQGSIESARASAQRAITSYGDAEPDQRRQVEQWLRDHPAP